jgi:hypothetical protein
MTTSQQGRQSAATARRLESLSPWALRRGPQGQVSWRRRRGTQPDRVKSGVCYAVVVSRGRWPRLTGPL